MRKIRNFFDAREVLEVETPLLSQHATVDRHIESFSSANRWLHTSPEFAMKRLLAAGSGAIWQSCKVFRSEESGQFHNPEFSLLEWYRPGMNHHQMMDEVEALLVHLGAANESGCARISYRQAFEMHAQLEPHSVSAEAVRERLRVLGVALPAKCTDAEVAEKDFWLDLMMSYVVAPKLGLGQPCFVYNFPASQAALARIDGEHAERFEVFWQGVELANGFHELTDASEQRQRFERDQNWRAESGKSVPAYDANLIAALASGLPDCAGVAMGLDRLLMLLLAAPTIGSVLAFEWQRA